jgi:hypothetical protein
MTDWQKFLRKMSNTEAITEERIKTISGFFGIFIFLKI